MKVFLPTDFSDSAHHASVFAINLFGLEGVEYTLLTLYHEPHAAATSMISLVEIAMQDARKSLMTEEKNLKEKFGTRLKLSGLCEYGEGGGQIARLAIRHAANVIVMGTKGASGLKEVLIGSVAATTVQKSEVPVLVVPDTAKSPRFTKALAAIDDNYDVSAIDKLRLIAGALDMNLAFVSMDVTGNKTSADKEIKPDFLQKGEEHSWITGADLVSALAGSAEQSGAQVVAMFPGKHGFFERLFKKSNSALFAMHSDMPLLTVRKGNPEA